MLKLSIFSLLSFIKFHAFKQFLYGVRITQQMLFLHCLPSCIVHRITSTFECIIVHVSFIHETEVTLRSLMNALDFSLVLWHVVHGFVNGRLMLNCLRCLIFKWHLTFVLDCVDDIFYLRKKMSERFTLWLLMLN